MLDEKLLRVMTALQDLCPELDVFKILDAEEILAKLPEGEELTKLQLSVIIKELKEREFIKVKYFNVDEYCLSVSQRAKIEQEKHDDEIAITTAIATGDFSPIIAPVVTTADGKTIKVKRRKIASFWGAFLGALLGGGIITAVNVILQLFVL